MVLILKFEVLFQRKHLLKKANLLFHPFTGKSAQSAGDSHLSGHWHVSAGEC